MPRIILIAHNIRSTHNVGSLMRTAEGLGVEMIYLTGYTPYPEEPADKRLPHIRRKLTAQIHKTALGAETMLPWRHYDDISDCLNELTDAGYKVVALEQTLQSRPLRSFKPGPKTVLIVGNEVTGIEKDILEKIKDQVYIPMNGRKESYNVAIAAAIALYHLAYLG